MIHLPRILFLLGSFLFWGLYWVPFGWEVYDYSLFFGESAPELKLLFPYSFLGIYCLALFQAANKEKLVLAPRQMSIMIYALCLLALPLFFSQNSESGILMMSFVVTIYLGFFSKKALQEKPDTTLMMLGGGTLLGTILQLSITPQISSFALSLGWLLFVGRILRSNYKKNAFIGVIVCGSLGAIAWLGEWLVLLGFLALLVGASQWFLFEKRVSTKRTWLYGATAIAGIILSFPQVLSWPIQLPLWNIRYGLLGTGPGEFIIEKALWGQQIIDPSLLSGVRIVYEWGIVGVLGFVLTFLLIQKNNRKNRVWLLLLLLLGFFSINLTGNGNSFLWWGLLLFTPPESPLDHPVSRSTRR